MENLRSRFLMVSRWFPTDGFDWVGFNTGPEDHRACSTNRRLVGQVVSRFWISRFQPAALPAKRPA
jgi:hypothetical protein